MTGIILPMDIDSVVDASVTHGHHKWPVIFFRSSWRKCESNMGDDVPVENGMNALCVIASAIFEAMDLIDCLVGGRSVIRHDSEPLRVGKGDVNDGGKMEEKRVGFIVDEKGEGDKLRTQNVRKWAR